MVKLKAFLAKPDKLLTVSTVTMTTQDTEMSETTLKDMLRSDLMEHRIKPKLYLPKFSGEIIHFQSFWESFTSAVHQNPD